MLNPFRWFIELPNIQYNKRTITDEYDIVWWLQPDGEELPEHSRRGGHFHTADFTMDTGWCYQLSGCHFDQTATSTSKATLLLVVGKLKCFNIKLYTDNHHQS